MQALIIIDMQNDFCLPTGALAVKQAEDIILPINQLINRFNFVIATQDYHPANHLSFAENHPNLQIGNFVLLNRDKSIGNQLAAEDIALADKQMLWPTHCVQNTVGAKFHAQLASDKINKVIRKGQNPKIDSYSAFFDNAKANSTGLSDLLKQANIDEIFICGVATDYCVAASAKDGLSERFKVKIIQDAIKGVNINPNDSEQELSYLASLGAQIIDSKSLF